MMPSPPRPHLVRLSAVLIFIGLPALLLTLSLINLLEIASVGDTLRERAMQAAALERRLGQPASGNQIAEPALLIEGTSRTAAIALLQQDLLDAVAEAAGRIVETASMDEAVSEGQDADRIEVKTTLDIDNDGFLRLLYRLESELPLMDVATLSVRRLPGNGDEMDAIMLRVDMTVSARWKPATTAGGS